MKKPNPDTLVPALQTIETLTLEFATSLKARKALRQTAANNRRRYLMPALAAAAVISPEPVYRRAAQNTLWYPFKHQPPTFPRTRDPITRTLRALEKLETLLPPFLDDQGARDKLREAITHDQVQLRHHLL